MMMHLVLLLHVCLSGTCVCPCVLFLLMLCSSVCKHTVPKLYTTRICGECFLLHMRRTGQHVVMLVSAGPLLPRCFCYWITAPLLAFDTQGWGCGHGFLCLRRGLCAFDVSWP